MNEGKELLYISQAEVCQLGMPLKQVLDLVEESYSEKAKGYLQNSPKAIIPVAPGCNSYAMPALMQSTDYFGMNWQSCFNANLKTSLVPTSGVIGLYRKPTGIQIAIVEDSYIDAWCRGAMAGLCARYLANTASKTIAIIGCGYWAKYYLLGILLALPSLENVLIYDDQRARCEVWLTEMKEEAPGLNYKTTALRDAVAQADILITADVLQQGLAEKGEIEAGWLKKGCLVVSANQDQQFIKGVINQDVDTLVTDDLPQYIEKKDAFVKDIAATPLDLLDYVTGKAKRQNTEETIFCCLLGMSVCNTMVAYDIFLRALDQNLGQAMAL